MQQRPDGPLQWRLHWTGQGCLPLVFVSFFLIRHQDDCMSQELGQLNVALVPHLLQLQKTPWERNKLFLNPQRA
jgi:hypothetical protein